MKRFSLLCGPTLLVAAILSGSLYFAAAQRANQWTPVQAIPDYDRHARAPFMVADRNGTVHAVSYQSVGEDRQDSGVFYRRWTPAEGWSQPVDILLGGSGGPHTIQGFFLDRNSNLHLIYFVGVEEQATISHIWAPAALAGRAPAWSEPQAVGLSAGPLPFAAITGDDTGHLYIVYDGTAAGVGLYEVRSADWGATWSRPALVALARRADLWPTSIRLDVDSHGRLHAVWSLINEGAAGEEIYYAYLDPDNTSWSTPVVLARRDPDDYSTNWPSLIVRDDELIVVYQDGVTPPTKWMIRSKDNGRTWTAPVRPWLHEGEYENVVLLKDGVGQIHAVMGGRIGNPGTHGMWHSILISDTWSSLEPIVTGPKTPDFDPSAPKGVILLGNTLLTAWWTDTDVEHRNGAWYSYTVLNAPEQPREPLPTPVPTATPISYEAVATASAPTPTPVPELDREVGDAALSSPAMPLLAGVVPVVAVIAVVFVWRLSRRGRP